jgi:predicted dehydrogenase
MTRDQRVRVGLAGATAGYGLVHRRNLARLAAAGRTRLVAVADPAGRPDDLDPDVGWYPGLGELLAAESCDVVIVATPIHTHADLAEQAMLAGAHVYLEKPPVASLAQFRRLLELAEQTGRACQAGFQALGSLALPRIEELVAEGAIGEPTMITGIGVWSRTRAYFDRAAWSGRRRLGDRVVSDGVATNALAHAVAQALRVAGVRDLGAVDSVQTELYRANLDNESDDTSWIRVEAPGTLPVSCALTLCGPGNDQPPVTGVIGSSGRIELQYTQDLLTVDRGNGQQTEPYGRIDLLENLLDHLADGTELISPLTQSGAYMAVLEAIQATDPLPLTDGVTIEGSGSSAHPVIEDIDHLARQAAESGDGFAGAGAPWASTDARRTWTPPG